MCLRLSPNALAGRSLLTLVLSALLLVTVAQSSDDLDSVAAEASVDTEEVAAAPVVDWRVACIEAKESGGANVWNRTGSGAGGVLQYMPSTFARGAAEMGHSEYSLWVPWQARLVAAHDLAMGRRRQWTVSGC